MGFVATEKYMIDMATVRYADWFEDPKNDLESELVVYLHGGHTRYPGTGPIPEAEPCRSYYGAEGRALWNAMRAAIASQPDPRLTRSAGEAVAATVDPEKCKYCEQTLGPSEADYCHKCMDVIRERVAP